MKKQDLGTLLQSKSYPGRGIALGRSANGKYAVAAYFIMGRSVNSRNRVLLKTERVSARRHLTRPRWKTRA